MLNEKMKGGYKQMNKNGLGKAGTFLMVFAMLAVVGMLGYFIFFGQGTTPQTGASSVQQVAQATQEGRVATVKVFVRNVAADDINTKVAVATYCQDNDGKFIIDATASSTTTEISGQTTRGKTVTCWAFNSSFQTVMPEIVTVDEEVEHVLIDGFSIPNNGRLQFYTDTLATQSGNLSGRINVTGVGASSTGSLAKFRYTNNETNDIYPLAGVFFDTITSSNVSDVRVTGGGALSLRKSSFLPQVTSMEIISSTLSTRVSSRRDLWDYVFEVDSNLEFLGNTGASPVLLEENDYVESGTISVLGDGDGCGTSTIDLISSYAFTKGYYRATMTDTVTYGHENDASSSAVINTDITGDTFYCRA